MTEEPTTSARQRSRLSRLSRLLPSVGWTALSQLLSSLSNLVLSISVGRAGGASLLGQFTLAFTAYLLAMGFQRALISEPLMSLPAQQERHVDRAALSSALIFGTAVAVATAAAGLVTGIRPLLVLALMFVPLLLQDHLRFQAFQRLDARRAAELDLIWFVLTVAAWPLLVSAGSVELPILLWGAGAGVASVYGLLRARTAPARAATARRWWMADARRVGGALAVESTVHSLAIQGLAFGLAAVIGVSELGRLRAGQILLGFAGTALVTFNVLVLPRLAARGGALSARQAAALCGLATTVSLAAVGGSIVIAPWMEEVFFGGRLEVDVMLLLGLGAVLVLNTSTAGLVLHMKALRRVGGYTIGRLVVALVGTPLIVLAGAIGGLNWVVAAMAGLAVVYSVSDTIAWTYARRAAASESAAA